MSINPYRAMWAIVTFDLPTITPKNREDYVQFRRSLLKEGFIMLQYSVYIRPFGSPKHMDTIVHKVESILPPAGRVTILPMTDRQYGMTKHFYMTNHDESPPGYEQLKMF